ncbi:iron-containing alcohol dehydrogenase [Alteromonas lipolytica]|uniref:Uncharacterized protein n=1 Tax=Alteromonas lipolytica TaxID=1856405 RepID=A0A1E8FJ49_9ALTE|nr:iron-containing alcohol dehydrogenase [Alteromonas lipolytica]OFI35473.1 hypothetical protein BFC17_11950 [Alteromonas lipolytica]GGF76557.1 alcohol dehydrogenase [Alteromonas lipolytica]
MTQTTWQITVPPVAFGPGSLQQLTEIIVNAGYSKPMLVTDPGVNQLPSTESLKQQLSQAFSQLTVYHDVKGNPTRTNVDTGITQYRQAGCDCLVALGGGSAIDVAKGISLTAHNSNDLWDFCFFEDEESLPEPIGADFFVPLVIIPTTAGTGSELSGSSCVITDEAQQRKRVAYHPAHFPFAIIDDPELLLGLPASLTAWTGMDALTHALEAYCAPDFQPACDGIALEAISLCHDYLAKSVADGSDLKAREKVMAASSIAAIAFTSKGLGAVHSLAHAIGAMFDTHHGLANAVLLPYVLKFNAPAVDNKLCRLARLLDLPDASAQGVVEWVAALNDSLRIPASLQALDISQAALDDIAALAMRDTEHHTNPRTMSEQDFRSILTCAYNGAL